MFVHENLSTGLYFFRKIEPGWTLSATFDMWKVIGVFSRTKNVSQSSGCYTTGEETFECASASVGMRISDEPSTLKAEVFIKSLRFVMLFRFQITANRSIYDEAEANHFSYILHSHSLPYSLSFLAVSFIQQQYRSNGNPSKDINASRLKPFTPSLVPGGKANLELNGIAELVGRRRDNIHTQLELI